VGTVPVGVWNTDALVGGFYCALNAIEECSNRTEATSIGIKLASSAFDAFNTVPESTDWTDTLAESIIPDSSIFTRLIWDTFYTIEIRSTWASV
jgi:hypothetical protein